MIYVKRRENRERWPAYVAVGLFAVGVVLAGSDGAWFPLPNFVGAVMISVAGLIGWAKSK